MGWGLVLLLAVLITVFVHISRQKDFVKNVMTLFTVLCLLCKYYRLKKDYEKLKRQIYRDSKKS